MGSIFEVNLSISWSMVCECYGFNIRSELIDIMVNGLCYGFNFLLTSVVTSVKACIEVIKS